MTTPLNRLVFLTSFMLSHFFCSCKPAATNSSKIVHGVNTTIQNFPYQISLEENSMHICGGSILSRRYILTAAHCIANEASHYKIRAGSSYFQRGGKLIQVKRTHVHPKFSMDTLDYDIAILYLEKDLKFNGKTICKVKLPAESDKFEDGLELIASGWGTTEKGSFADVLQCVTVPIINQKQCSKYYSNHTLDVTDRMICAGYPEGVRDACNGDSGGPLVHKCVQVGIVSWGFECGKEKFPGIYSRVTRLRRYIKHVTGI